MTVQEDTTGHIHDFIAIVDNGEFVSCGSIRVVGG